MKYTVYGGVRIVYEKGFSLSNDKPGVKRTHLTLAFNGEMSGNTRPQVEEIFPIDIWDCSEFYNMPVTSVVHPQVSKGVRKCCVYIEDIEYPLESETDIDNIDKMTPEKVGMLIERLIRSSIIPSLQKQGFIDFNWF